MVGLDLEGAARHHARVVEVAQELQQGCRLGVELHVLGLEARRVLEVGLHLLERGQARREPGLDQLGVGVAARVARGVRAGRSAPENQEEDHQGFFQGLLA